MASRGETVNASSSRIAGGVVKQVIQHGSQTELGGPESSIKVMAIDVLAILKSIQNVDQDVTLLKEQRQKILAR